MATQAPTTSATVYMTTQGSEDVTRAARESDAHLGIESTWRAADDDPVAFIDYPFTDESATFEDHLAVVAEHEPALTVAPDVEAGRRLDDVVDQADRLDEHADAVVVVPKDVHPSEVPDRFRVGVPLANFGSGAKWAAWDYVGCGPVHLLGGSPNRQLALGAHLPVSSVDTATLGQRCRFGTWERYRCVDDPPEDWDYRQRLRHALNEYAAAWA